MTSILWYWQSIVGWLGLLESAFLQDSKWREAWPRGLASSPRSYGEGMVFSRLDLWRQIYNLYKILYIRAYVFVQLCNKSIVIIKLNINN